MFWKIELIKPVVSDLPNKLTILKNKNSFVFISTADWNFKSYRKIKKKRKFSSYFSHVHAPHTVNVKPLPKVLLPEARGTHPLVSHPAIGFEGATRN